MAQGRPRDERKRQQWQQWLQQWQSSGLTVRAFCNLYGLTEASFYAWRRQLRQPQRSPVPFLPVHVVAEADDPSEPALEVVLAGGRRLRVAPGFDARTLRELLAVLEEASPC
jgi:transposase-like protein